MYDDEVNIARTVARGSRWVIGGGIVTLLLVIVLASMWIFGWGFFQRATADFRGETAALEQIKADPAHRISARAYFYQTCSDVQAQEDRLKLLQDELDGGVSESRKEQIHGAMTAISSKRSDLIRTYNTKAQNFTYEQFRDADLPEYIDVASERTRCVAGDE